MMIDIKELNVQVAGMNTHYHEAGEGQSVLFIHGSGPGVSAWANWRLALPEMAKQFHVFAPDVAGFGQSHKPAPPATDQVWADHMIAFIEEVIEGKSVSIVGNSMGGAIALHVAYRRPDLVNKLVLMGSMGVDFTLTEGLDAVWGYSPSKENMKQLIGIFTYDQSMAQNDDLVQMRYESSIEEGSHESFSSMFPAPRQQNIDALALNRQQLQTIKHKSLIIHGRDDQIIPLETSMTLLRELPYADLHVFTNCGHRTQIERSDDFIKQIKDFLE